MMNSGTQAVQDEPAAISGAIPFQFAISWRSLIESEAPSAAMAAGRGPIGRLPVLEETPSKPLEAVPAFLAVSNTIAPAFVESAGLLSAPSFTPAFNNSSRRNWAALAGFALLIVILALTAMRRTDRSPASPDAPPVQTMEMGGTGWMSEWVTDRIGSALGRQISLYRPSLLMSDYRLDFQGRIEQRSLGWVFRAVDAKNYQVAKLQASGAGAPLTLIRFGVVRGVEDPHVQIKLPFVSGSGTLKVRLDAIGSRFTIYLQNKVIEDWQDDRLKSGGVGFLNQREERGQVESVEISFQKAGVRQ